MNRLRNGTAGTWLLAGLASACIAIMLGILAWTFSRGFEAFWPSRIERITLVDGRVLLGQVVADDDIATSVRIGSTASLTDAYARVRVADIAERDVPADAWVIEGEDGSARFGLGAAPAGEAALPANQLALYQRVGVALQRMAAFLVDGPGASNLSGGVLPALVGTVTLVLLMSVFVLPLGVATAVYLHRRRGGPVRFVRAAIDILAGIPAIVHGVLGLGLFVHAIGGSLDRWLFPERLPVPTFGSGGLLWAALTLALLTVPVVVVSVEQGLARIPRSLVVGSLALGATHQETLWRLLLPAARPAILTGLILAIARAAGSVAPLMLVGVVKLASAMPLDGSFPYLHPSRQFTHLGYAVYDAALASPDAVRGVSRAYACAALLVLVVIVLELSAILLRKRLRERYRALEG